MKLLFYFLCFCIISACTNQRKITSVNFSRIILLYSNSSEKSIIINDTTYISKKGNHNVYTHNVLGGKVVFKGNSPATSTEVNWYTDSIFTNVIDNKLDFAKNSLGKIYTRNEADSIFKNYMLELSSIDKIFLDFENLTFKDIQIYSNNEFIVKYKNLAPSKVNDVDSSEIWVNTSKEDMYFCTLLNSSICDLVSTKLNRRKFHIYKIKHYFKENASNNSLCFEIQIREM
ncbi:MAG: hypothetical protein ACK4HE_07960 [Chitinophagaceae bacterium]